MGSQVSGNSENTAQANFLINMKDYKLRVESSVVKGFVADQGSDASSFAIELHAPAYTMIATDGKDVMCDFWQATIGGHRSELWSSKDFPGV